MREFGAATIIEERLPRFLIWQSIQSIPVYFLGKTLLSPLAPSTTLLAAVYALILFQLSLVVFSTCLFMASAPEPVGGVSPTELLSCLHKLIFVYGCQPLPPELRWRAKVMLRLVLFVAFSGVSASLAVVCLYGSVLFGALGLKGFIIGLVYGLSYKIWIYDFHMIQRAPYYRYKMGVGKAFIDAVKLASIGGVCVVVFVLPISGQLATGDLIEHGVFCFASFVVLLCWELNRNLLQVIMTKRLVFAPPENKASSDYLIEALEEKHTLPVVGYLAYLDLCMVCESKLETWRRSAFFQGSGETYNKVIALCLDPLDQLTLNLTDSCATANEPFYQLQVCEWGARSASSLIVASKKEDGLPLGVVARGSYAAVLSTLLSCLMAVEAALLMGKKTNHDDVNDSTKLKAYSMAGILKTSIYQIVSNFSEEMVASSTKGLLEQEWIGSGGKYGSRDLLAHKLQMFLEFQAT